MESNMNNNIILDGCIEEFNNENELEIHESELFELFCLAQVSKHVDLTFDDLENSVIDGGQDGGIDSIMLLLDDDYIEDIDSLSEYKFSSNTKFQIIISQAKAEKNFKETAIDKLITSFPVLLDLEQDEEQLSQRFNPALVTKILTLRELWLKTVKKGGSIGIDINYFCKANEVQTNAAYVSKVNQLKTILSEKINGSKVNFQNHSSKELLDLYQKQKPTRLELIFKEVPITTKFNDGYGYAGIVSIKDYYDFITDDDGNILENIFESNIRHYQGDVDVNNKIRESLESEFEIDFWWLNNGITIIAESPSQISKTLSLENVQIVNGLQTTFTLDKYFKNCDTEHNDIRSILIKVIILDSEANKKATDKIIASTNSQNAVPPVLLRATDDIQRKIELYFSNEGYFYDRRKNFYKNTGKPASKIFTIQSTAQAIQSIVHRECDTARAKPTTLIKTKESYEKIFNEDTPFQIYLTCALINKSVRDYIKLYLSKEDKSLAKAYAWHLSQCLVSVLTGKSDYAIDDMKSINVKSIKNEDHDKSFKILTELVEVFKSTSKTTSDSSVSKSGKFRDFLNDEIKKKL